MSAAIKVQVLDWDGWRQWLNQHRPSDEAPFAARVQAIAEQGWAPIVFRDTGRMSWVCPSCGSCTGGQLGGVPVSGWDEPRWVKSGPEEAPTLTPSLGCPLWREGHCQGHYWLRDGTQVYS